MSIEPVPQDPLETVGHAPLETAVQALSETPAPTAPVVSPPLGRAARFIVPLLALCALAALFWPRGTSSYAAPPGLLVDAGGRSVPLAGELGPVTLVHFWATWCPPCRTELPALDRLRADFAGEPNLRVVLIAVADRPEAVGKFPGTLAPRSLYDPRWEVAHRYGTQQLPETYIVSDGQVVQRFEGAVDWDDAKIRQRLQGLLAERRRS